MMVNYLQGGRGKLCQIKSVIASRGKDSRLRTRRARALSRQEATPYQGGREGTEVREGEDERLR
jgi:hypothetical protein